MFLRLGCGCDGGSLGLGEWVGVGKVGGGSYESESDCVYVGECVMNVCE